MKTTEFRTFPAGSGDCIFILVRDNDNNTQYSVMVDCGETSADIEDYIKDSLHKHIDLLVVTHIDGDHVNGVVQLLNNTEFSDLQIDKIIFNCFQRKVIDNSKELEPSARKRLDALMQKMPPNLLPSNGKTSCPDAATLAQAIMQKEEWNKAWIKEPVMRNQTINDSELCSITILSPIKDDLDTLLDTFKSEFHKWTQKDFPDYDVVDQESIFQHIIELADAKAKGKGRVKNAATVSLEEEMIKCAEDDADEEAITKSNFASISFVCHTPDKNILVMGDAPSSRVIDGLFQDDNDKQIIFDVIKVAHHGSKHNTSKSLVKKVDARDWFITGGNDKQRPSLESIAKIALRPLPDGWEERKIHCNRKNEITDRLDTEKGKKIQAKKHFKILIDGTL